MFALLSLVTKPQLISPKRPIAMPAVQPAFIESNDSKKEFPPSGRKPEMENQFYFPKYQFPPRPYQASKNKPDEENIFGFILSSGLFQPSDRIVATANNQELPIPEGYHLEKIRIPKYGYRK